MQIPENKIRSNEFFETMFGGDPIPKTKIDRVIAHKIKTRGNREKVGPVIIEEPPEKDGCHHCHELVEKE